MKKHMLVALALIVTITCVHAQSSPTATCAVISPDINDGVLVAAENHHVLFETRMSG